MYVIFAHIWLISMVNVGNYTIRGSYGYVKKYRYLEPETSIKKWLFPLDDSKSLHWKWLEITKHPLRIGSLGFQVNK